MLSFNTKNFASVYVELCRYAQHGDVIINSNNITTRELTNVSFQIENPRDVLFKNFYRSSKTNYIAREIAWYINGNEDVTEISKYAPLWGKISDHKNTVNSNYGHTIFRKQNKHGYNSWYWAVSHLAKDKHTRKAYIPVNRPDDADPFTNDYVCCEGIHFMIRDNRLNMTVNFRSTDLLLGLPNDIAFMGFLQTQMYNIMRTHHFGLKLGYMTYNINSLHLYLKDFDTIFNMLKHSFFNGTSLKLANVIEPYGTINKKFSDIKIKDAHKEFKNLIIE